MVSPYNLKYRKQHPWFFNRWVVFQIGELLFETCVDLNFPAQFFLNEWIDLQSPPLGQFRSNLDPVWTIEFGILHLTGSALKIKKLTKKNLVFDLTVAFRSLAGRSIDEYRSEGQNTNDRSVCNDNYNVLYMGFRVRKLIFWNVVSLVNLGDWPSLVRPTTLRIIIFSPCFTSSNDKSCYWWQYWSSTPSSPEVWQGGTGILWGSAVLGLNI
jgi:hypothetical protein